MSMRIEEYEEVYGLPFDHSMDGQLLLVRRLSDHAQIPVADDNIDYLEYLAWKAAGGIPTIVDQSPRNEA